MALKKRPQEGIVETASAIELQDGRETKVRKEMSLQRGKHRFRSGVAEGREHSKEGEHIDAGKCVHVAVTIGLRQGEEINLDAF